MTIINNPCKLISEENQYKFTQKQHDILNNNYKKIFILEKDIVKSKFILEKYEIDNDITNIKKYNQIITTMDKELEKYNIMQYAILDFIL